MEELLACLRGFALAIMVAGAVATVIAVIQLWRERP